MICSAVCTCCGKRCTLQEGHEGNHNYHLPTVTSNVNNQYINYPNIDTANSSNIGVEASPWAKEENDIYFCSDYRKE